MMHTTNDPALASAVEWMAAFYPQSTLAQVAAHLRQVRDMTYRSISDAQAVALTSLAYDIGTAALRSSVLMVELNGGHFDVAGDSFMHWTVEDGLHSVAMADRRRRERALFLDAGHAVADLVEAEGA